MGDLLKRIIDVFRRQGAAEEVERLQAENELLKAENELLRDWRGSAMSTEVRYESIDGEIERLRKEKEELRKRFLKAGLEKFVDPLFGRE